jgi:hypothetical protein
MASPFPGMDPYLEQATLWPEFHSRLIVALADVLAPSLLPKYYVAVETRTYLDSGEPASSPDVLVGIPDAVVLSTQTRSSPMPSEDVATGIATVIRPQSVLLPMPMETKERYLEVRETGSDAVITVIEVLSPANKRPGEGRRLYSTQRQTILGSASHLVEIDLLRVYEPMAMHPVTTGLTSTGAYRILVSRAADRPRADLYAFSIQDPIPAFPLPLKETDAAVTVEMQSLVNGIYGRSGYGLRLNYQTPVPAPDLSTADQIWVTTVLNRANAGTDCSG